MGVNGNHGDKKGMKPGGKSNINDDMIMNTRKKIVLAGNPNTGKSVFFNHFTGMYVDVSNYPGTTLEISSGHYGEYDVQDTPGVYGISSFNDEERVARDVILGADLIINVVSSLYLERDLFLTQQIIDTGLPVIVALNMLDEAQKNGVTVDVQKLSNLLGVPVIPTVAVKKEGFEELSQSLEKACKGHVTPGLEKMLSENLLSCEGKQGHALLYLEGDPTITQKYGLIPSNKREEIYRRRRERVNDICAQTIVSLEQGYGIGVKLGRWMLRPLTGIPILLFCLWLMYEFVGVFISGTVVDFTEGAIMTGHYEPFIRSLVGAIMPLNSLPGIILAGEFGLLTMTVTYLLGLLLPLVAGFYFILAIFEDSGYLPRIATLVDRLLTSIGLNGRGVIPIILGFGCVTMATITTRLLSSEREKIIAIFLLGLTIPCSAQLGIIVGLLAGLGAQYVLLYVTVIFVVMVMAGTLLNAFLPGESTCLLIDLPPIRLPRFTNVCKKTINKTLAFLREAIPLFALGALLITVLQISGGLEKIQQWLAPLTVSWLGLPADSATAFVMGLVRRDFGAAGLTELTLTHMQTLVSLVVITLFVPCIASVMMILKERTRLEGLWIWGGSIVIAFVTGGVLYQMSKYLGGNQETTMAFVIIVAAVLAWLGIKWFTKIRGAKHVA